MMIVSCVESVQLKIVSL